MWFQFIVINVGLGDGYVLMLPERKTTRLERGLVSFRACPFAIFLKVKSRSVFIQNKHDGMYTVLEMGVPGVQARFPSA